MSPPAFNGIPVELLLAVFTADDGGRKDGTIEDELNGAGILPGCREPSQSCVHGNQCLNGGRCIQEWSSHHCDCSMTSFVGARCQKVGLAYEFGAHGNGVMTYRFPKGDWPDSKQDKIAFGILTNQKSATILKIESGSGSDFIEIFLKNGRIASMYNVGKSSNHLSSSDVTLDDSKYHVVRFVRSGANATLQSDEGRVARFNAIGDQRTVFNHQSVIRIGGRRTTSTGKVRKSFKGILRGLVINGMNIFEMASANLSSITIEGSGIRPLREEHSQERVSSQISGNGSEKDFSSSSSIEGDTSDFSGMTDLIDDDEDYNKIITTGDNQPGLQNPLTISSTAVVTKVYVSTLTEANVVIRNQIVLTHSNGSESRQEDNSREVHQVTPSPSPSHAGSDRQIPSSKNGANLIISVRTPNPTAGLPASLGSFTFTTPLTTTNSASSTPTNSDPKVFRLTLTRLANILPGWTLILAICLGSAVVLLLLALATVAIKRYASGRNRGSYTVDSSGPVPSSFCYRHKRCGKGVCSVDRNDCDGLRGEKFHEATNNGLLASGTLTSFQLKQQTFCEFDSVVDRKLDAMSAADSFQWKSRRRRMMLRAWLWCSDRDTGPADVNNERSLLFNYKCCSTNNYNESPDNVCSYCGHRRHSSGPVSDLGSERCSCNLEQAEEEKTSIRTTNLWQETDRPHVGTCYSTPRVPPPPPPLAVPPNEMANYIFNSSSPSRKNNHDSPASGTKGCRSSSLTSSWLGPRFEPVPSKSESARASLPRDAATKPGSKNRRGLLKKSSAKTKSKLNSSATMNKEWYV